LRFKNQIEIINEWRNLDIHQRLIRKTLPRRKKLCAFASLRFKNQIEIINEWKNLDIHQRLLRKTLLGRKKLYAFACLRFKKQIEIINEWRNLDIHQRLLWKTLLRRKEKNLSTLAPSWPKNLRGPTLIKKKATFPIRNHGNKIV
jgi:3-methyladenine DNA glycosylase AlkD